MTLHIWLHPWFLAPYTTHNIDTSVIGHKNLLRGPLLTYLLRCCMQNKMHLAGNLILKTVPVLQNVNNCTASPQELQKQALELFGVFQLLHSRPECLLGTRTGPKACIDWSANAETGLYIGGCGQKGGGPEKGCDMNFDQVAASGLVF